MGDRVLPPGNPDIHDTKPGHLERETRTPMTENPDTHVRGNYKETKKQTIRKQRDAGGEAACPRATARGTRAHARGPGLDSRLVAIGVDPAEWAALEAHVIAHGKPATPDWRKKTTRRLVQLHGEGHDPNDCIDRAIRNSTNGWPLPRRGCRERCRHPHVRRRRAHRARARVARRYGRRVLARNRHAFERHGAQGRSQHPPPCYPDRSDPPAAPPSRRWGCGRYDFAGGAVTVPSHGWSGPLRSPRPPHPLRGGAVAAQPRRGTPPLPAVSPRTPSAEP